MTGAPSVVGGEPFSVEGVVPLGDEPGVET
jgi:hypothetical protein